MDYGYTYINLNQNAMGKRWYPRYPLTLTLD
jgi:hypothetical protein